MTRKKKIVIWMTVIVVLVGCFLALRIPSWTRNYGLPEEVIAGERMPTAEETIRLYYYYCARRDFQKTEQLVTESGMDERGSSLLEEIESIVNWLLMDHKILAIESLYVFSDGENSEETATEVIVSVQEAEGILWVSPITEKCYFEYKLVRVDRDHPWQIDEIGTGF